MAIDTTKLQRGSILIFWEDLNNKQKRAFLNECRARMGVNTDDSVRHYISGSRTPPEERADIMESVAEGLGFDKKDIWD